MTLERAIAIAAEAHADQVDKGGQELVQIEASELARLRKIEAAYRAKFCSRCGKAAIYVTGQLCGEKPCPIRKYLPQEAVEWRARHPDRIDRPQLPVQT